jgi:hypothetical protein
MSGGQPTSGGTDNRGAYRQGQQPGGMTGMGHWAGGGAVPAGGHMAQGQGMSGLGPWSGGGAVGQPFAQAYGGDAPAPGGAQNFAQPHNGFGGGMTDYSLTGGTGGLDPMMKSGAGMPMKTPKNVGQDGGVTDANGNVIAAGPATPPAATPNAAPPPAAGGGYGSGPVNIQPPGQYLGIPHYQPYGGQPAPYGSLHDQIRDAFNNNSTGAGRFGSNAAARFGFAGPAFWSPDSMAYQGRGDASQRRYSPQAPLQAPPMTPPPGGGINPPPAAGGPPGQTPGGVDHMGNFQKLLQQDPSGRLAMGYSQYGGARDWTQKNQGAIDKMLQSQGGFGGVRSKYGAGNRFLESNEETDLMRMAGLRV